jgi:aqualysin 1
MRRTLPVLVALLACVMSWSGADAQRTPPSTSATHVIGVRTSPATERGRAVPGRFIVFLEPKIDPHAVARDHGVQPKYIYTKVVNGFAGPMSDLARSGLLRDSRVRRVEPVRYVHATATANSWGIDRIDQRALPLNGGYVTARTGRGVSAYVVDTGIRFDHQLFAGRAVRGVDEIGDGQNGNDCDGHGTHVAGTIGGAFGYGVASGVKLVSVRVLDCQGSGLSSGVIAGLDWIAANGQRPAVVNMSLGGDPDPATDEAVRNLIAAGFPVVVAAGNDGVDACGSSPARVSEAITVGATNNADSRTSWSNYGNCLDVFAPGDGIVSAYYTSSTALAGMSGTSMAAPHIAGAAALILEGSPSASPATVRNNLYNSATPSVVTNAASANNRLLFVGSDTATAPTSGGVTIRGTTADDIIAPTQSVTGQPLPTAQNDTIYGLAGNDRLDGGAGADRMEGGTGNDLFFVDNPSDIVVENVNEGTDEIRSKVTYTLPGNVERLRLLGTTVLTGRGNALPNVLYANDAGGSLVGGSGNDSFVGGAGADNLYGGDGNDILRGNGGADRFRFDRPLNSSTNVDRIADFVGGQDKIYLASRIFTAAGPVGTLALTAFTAGTAATAASQRILYDASTGNLYYDPDGSGPATKVRFATVTAGAALRNTDFVIY